MLFFPKKEVILTSFHREWIPFLGFLKVRWVPENANLSAGEFWEKKEYSALHNAQAPLNVGPDNF